MLANKMLMCEKMLVMTVGVTNVIAREGSPVCDSPGV